MLEVDKVADWTVLTGRFTRVDLSYLRARANNASDERRVFYKAMLDHQTYEAYLDAVGGIKVFAPTFGRGEEPITGRAEILYARRNHRIEDVPGLGAAS